MLLQNGDSAPNRSLPEQGDEGLTQNDSSISEEMERIKQAFINADRRVLREYGGINAATAFRVLVEAAYPDVADALTVQGVLLNPVCQEELYSDVLAPRP